MRCDRIRRCFAPGVALLTVLCAGSAALGSDEDKSKKPQLLKYEFEEKGKEGEAKLDPTKPEDVEKFLERLKAGDVGDVEIEKAPAFLNVKWDLGLWSIIVFLGLMFILKKVAWAPMLEGLRNREDSIRKALEDAEAAKKETAELRQKLQSEMDKANDKVRVMIEDGRRDAQRSADEVLAKAKADIQAERDRLKREMDMARDQAIKELWEQTAQLATNVSSMVVRRQMGLDDHRRLVDESLAELRQAASDRVRSN